MASNFPIGLFDSGIGGLSIYNEIKNSMPNESTIYIADNLNAPYGKKAESEIIQLSICLLYTSPSPRDATLSRMPSSA